jgi:cytochrome bd ubiquinol oxidase subunit II
MDLNSIWFILVTVLIIGYAVLDGFDFGVGIIHLFTKSEDEKRVNLNSIGPVWDGNEVWLLTGGGALFAAFPLVYATVFSGFYLALMFLLVSLIFRAISIEFRGKVESKKWKKFWDWSFGLGSFLPAVLFGVAYGNILRGIPLNAKHEFLGNFFGLLNPYSILIGVLTLVLFFMHGSIYLTVKSEGEQQLRNKKWAIKAWLAFVVLYLISTFLTKVTSPFLFENIMNTWYFWVLLFFLIFFIIYTVLLLFGNKYFISLISSSLMIVCIIGMSALSLFPNLVPSNIDLNNSLTVYNASSTSLTLKTMLIIAIIGMPIVIIYTIYIYRVFKGKVIITKESY